MMNMDEYLDEVTLENRDYDDKEFEQEFIEFHRGDYDDYPEDDYYENWDNLEMGFDPYMGCYSDDC